MTVTPTNSQDINVQQVPAAQNQEPPKKAGWPSLWTICKVGLVGILSFGAGISLTKTIFEEEPKLTTRYEWEQYYKSPPSEAVQICDELVRNLDIATNGATRGLLFTERAPKGSGIDDDLGDNDAVEPTLVCRFAPLYPIRNCATREITPYPEDGLSYQQIQQKYCTKNKHGKKIPAINHVGTIDSLVNQGLIRSPNITNDNRFTDNTRVFLDADWLRPSRDHQRETREFAERFDELR